MLHNYLRLHESNVYCPPCFTDRKDNEGNIINGEWRDNQRSLGLERIARTGSNRGSWEADAVRETYCNYFVSEEGSLPWQSHYVHRTTYINNNLISYYYIIIINDSHCYSLFYSMQLLLM